MIEKGSDVKSKNCTGKTILHCAVNNNHLDMLDYFLKNIYVDVNSKDDDGWTPLHEAAIKVNFNPEVPRLLLQSGAEINSMDKDDWTSLHCAAQKGCLKAVIFLLQEGAQKDAKTKQNQTPFDMTVEELKKIEDGYYHSYLNVEKCANKDERKQAYVNLKEFASKESDGKLRSKALKRIIKAYAMTDPKKKCAYEDILQCLK